MDEQKEPELGSLVGVDHPFLTWWKLSRDYTMNWQTISLSLFVCVFISLDTCTKVWWDPYTCAWCQLLLVSMNMESSLWPSPMGALVFWHWLHMPLVPTVQPVCALLLAGLDSELSGARLHCWVQQNLWVDLTDMGHEDWMIQLWFIRIKASKYCDVLPSMHVKTFSSFYSKPLQFT